MHPEQLILKPLLTEKSSVEAETQNRYGFYVTMRANKNQIKEAVQKLYDVKVLKVRTSVLPGKLKRAGKKIGKTAPRKKAYVDIRPGQKIEFFKNI